MPRRGVSAIGEAEKGDGPKIRVHGNSLNDKKDMSVGFGNENKHVLGQTRENRYIKPPLTLPLPRPLLPKEG